MLFSPPSDTKAKDRHWHAFAKVGFRDSRYLWAEYWQRFNTITIPLLDQDAYFADALAAAQVAQDRQHLEQLLEQKSKERRAELEDVLGRVSIAAIFHRNPSWPEAARHSVGKVGRSGSLDSFVQLTSGIVWGWGDEQVGERRPRRESSPFTYIETQRPSYSPHPEVCDTWDLLEHGRDTRVREETASPERRQLLPPSPTLAASSITARIEYGSPSNGIGSSAREGSPKPPPNPSPKVEPAKSPPLLVSAHNTQTEISLPQSLSGSTLSLGASQAVSTGPSVLPGVGEAVIQPLLHTVSPNPRQGEHQDFNADACWGSLGEGFTPGDNSRGHEAQGSHLEGAARGKRARRKVG